MRILFGHSIAIRLVSPVSIRLSIALSIRLVGPLVLVLLQSEALVVISFLHEHLLEMWNTKQLLRANSIVVQSKKKNIIN